MNTTKLTIWAKSAGAAKNLGAALAVSVALTGAAQAQQYPTRNITVIIPFAGGSASDVVSRIMLDKMSRSMGQTIVVENRPGAGGNSGTLQGVRAAPDGYTLIGGGSGPVAANLSLYKSLGYDPEKDLEMISPFAGFTIVVVASKALSLTSLKDLIEHAKKNPGLNFGSVGIGSPLSQHRPVRAGPDRRHRTARLPVVSERRGPHPGQGRNTACGRG
jgi:tripartite-type tricarboxylate transporter receptor subunit TctC